ncbi:hypothetical protein ACO0LD_03315 [Undibacterium sp. Ji83W]|uniref:hypothetical protein n=1 Tax=Undibacterium sp. Ji83W TaxID=3413043 RepID=UPI003BF17529
MWIYRLGLSLLASMTLFMPCVALAMTVTFLNPGKSDEIYWVTASNGMTAAARSLGIQLEVIYSERDHLKTLEYARQIAARPANKRPDYVILSNDYAVGAEAFVGE